MPTLEPHLAASVILLRAPRPGALEVCMLRRRRGASFMASAFVFPGGGAEPGESLASCAARELFEEAGVALVAGAPDAATLEAARARVAAQKHATIVLGEAGLGWDEAALAPWSHWVTPSLEPRRFSAHFFVAALPAGQEPRFDDVETVEQIWLAPGDAAERAAALNLPPPQLRTLWEMAGLTSIAEVFAAARARAAEPHPILPRVAAEEVSSIPGGPAGSLGGKAQLRPGVVLLLPWDPDYLSRGQGEAAPMEPRPAWATGPSRFVMEDRAWRHLDAPGSTSAG